MRKAPLGLRDRSVTGALEHCENLPENAELCRGNVEHPGNKMGTNTIAVKIVYDTALELHERARANSAQSTLEAIAVRS